MTVARVLDNFVFRIEQISPTSMTSRQKFQHIDHVNLIPVQSDGMIRSFSTWWVDSDEVLEPTTFSERIQSHLFTVEVNYSTKIVDPLKLQKLILSDRHDLIKKLRHTDSWKGYDSNHTAIDVGIWIRTFEGDTLDREDPSMWVYRQQWRCDLLEKAA